MAFDSKKVAIIGGGVATLATFIMLWVKLCGSGTVGSDSHKLDKISSKIDSIAASTGVLEEYAQETHQIVTRTEKRVEKVQETADLTWDRVECNLPPCGGQPAPKPAPKPAPRDTNNRRPNPVPRDTNNRRPSDTIYVIIYDTNQSPKPEVQPVGVVKCTEISADPLAGFYRHDNVR